MAIIGNNGDARVLPIVEILFDSLPEGVNPIYSYEAKWIWDRSDNPLDIFECPARVTPRIQRDIETLCRKAYSLLRCRDWCRIDVRLDSFDLPHIIELNPLPGILPNPEDNSCFPKAARAAGMNYNQLIQTVLGLDIDAARRGAAVVEGRDDRARLHVDGERLRFPAVRVRASSVGVDDERLGPVVDGDCAGRAIPELCQTTAAICGVPFAGVLIADYWVIRKTNLKLADLYRPTGIYRYVSGWNWRAVTATVAGCALAWGGLVVPALRPLYSYAWFTGFFVAGVLHVALHRLWPARG